jgi:hypothetical protein
VWTERCLCAGNISSVFLCSYYLSLRSLSHMLPSSYSVYSFYALLFLLLCLTYDKKKLFVVVYGVSELQPPTSLLFITQVIYSYDYVGPRWSYINRESRISRKIPIPVPVCPSQMSHGLTRARTPASAVRFPVLTAWAMARPREVFELTIDDVAKKFKKKHR